MTHKYRGSIVVISISKSVEPNEERKEMTSGFQQGIICNHWNYRLPIISMLAENTLLKTAYHFLLLLVGVDTLTYQKDYNRSPILVGHQCYYSWLLFSCCLLIEHINDLHYIVVTRRGSIWIVMTSKAFLCFSRKHCSSIGVTWENHTLMASVKQASSHQLAQLLALQLGSRANLSWTLLKCCRFCILFCRRVYLH